MDIKNLLEQMCHLIDESPSNKVSEKDIILEKIFDYPLVKVAKASDPLFGKLKEPEVIGRHHLSPSEWLADARSVISYFLPFSKKVREANHIPRWPALEWLYGRIEGEEFNKLMLQYIINLVSESDGKAIAPILDPRYKARDLKSNWSERHAAYIAGLGTFSLSKSLITAKGCAGRYGSIITDLAINPSKRAYTELEDYCNRCGECIKRCPAGAVTEKGMDVQICLNYYNDEITPRYSPRYGCGKCQTAVACENIIP